MLPENKAFDNSSSGWPSRTKLGKEDCLYGKATLLESRSSGVNRVWLALA